MRCCVRTLLAVLLLAGCGGGTAGTGSSIYTKVFTGKVEINQDTPAVNATVRIQEGDTETTTDERGRYSVIANLDGPDATFEVRYGETSRQFSVNNLSPDTAPVAVDIRLDEQAPVVDGFEMTVESIGGEGCEGVFGPVNPVVLTGSSPLLVSSQRKEVSQGTTCTVVVRALNSGAPASGVSIAIFAVEAYPYFDPSNPGALSNDPSGGSLTQPDRRVSQGDTDADGHATLTFTLQPTNEQRYGTYQTEYFVIEAPLQLPRADRVGIVLDPLADYAE